MVQRLRLHAVDAGGLGSVSGQGTRSHTPQPRVCVLQLRPSTVKYFKKSNKLVLIVLTFCCVFQKFLINLTSPGLSWGMQDL